MCPEGQILNPKTNRCVSLTGKIGKELVASSSVKISKHIAEKVKITTQSKDVVESKTCPDGQILIPKTNR